MASGFQPFLISEFKTGINTYMQPWARPIDAFEPLVNAYINRGTINKRAGYSQFGNTLDDNNPVMGIMTRIDQATGNTTLLVATTVHLYLYNPGTDTFGIVPLPANFTGNISHFFNFTNWQASAGAISYLYMTNNRDKVVTYDGTVAAAFVPVVDGAGQTITKALDVVVYKQRLLLVRPTLSIDGIQNQSIYWSSVGNPDPATRWRTDIAGRGGFLAAPTGDIIQSVEFLRDVLVVFFTNSTWIFRFTGNETAPFRWDKVNDSKSTNSPYGSIPYDERCTSIGGTGLIACDGVNVQRYDVPIIDYYENNFSVQYYNQAFSQRYDNLNQGWTLYVSNENPFPPVGAIAPGSDSALIYNFVENSWATYTFSIPLTCLGMFNRQDSLTWAASTKPWQNVDAPWNAYSFQKNIPILLAGDTTGHVYFMDDQDEVTDNGTSIIPDIITTRWNPIMSVGEKVQFGYIDIYYYVASLDVDNPIQVTLNFYVDNSDNIATTRTLTLDGPTDSSFTFKRIYMNLSGQFVQMEIDPNKDSFMQFIGFILWARPSGRLTAP